MNEISKVYYVFRDHYELREYFRYIKSYVSGKLIPYYLYVGVYDRVILLNKVTEKLEISAILPKSDNHKMIKNLDEFTNIVESYDEP